MRLLGVLSCAVAACAVASGAVNYYVNNGFFNENSGVSSYGVFSSLLVGAAAREQRYAEHNSE